MQDAAETTLCVFTDLHIGHPCNGGFHVGELKDLDQLPGVAIALNALLKERKVDALVCCGDLIHDPNDKAALPALASFFERCTAGTSASAYAVLGNHDLWKRAIPNPADPEELWRSFPQTVGVGRPVVIAADRSIGHRIGNDLCDVFLCANRWSDDARVWHENTPPFGTLSDDTLEWLDEALASSTAACAIVVSHFPLHYFVNDMTVGPKEIRRLSEERRRLHAVLAKHPRALLHFTGHTHESRVTHGHGAIEVTTPAFNESPHFCRLVTVRRTSVTLETRVFDPHATSFDKVVCNASNPPGHGFQLGGRQDTVVSLEPPEEPSTDYITRLDPDFFRRLVRQGFETERDHLRNRAEGHANESAWEGYVGHSLTQMNESRKAFVEDINRYVLLYTVMLGTIFVVANNALNAPGRIRPVAVMATALALTYYTRRILALLREKARASYSYYVASSIHAFVVHDAFSDSSPHTWMAHVRNYLNSVHKGNLDNLRNVHERPGESPNPTWMRYAKHFRRFGFPCAADRWSSNSPRRKETAWNADRVRNNWQRIVEERWAETSSHRNGGNLLQSFDTAAGMSARWLGVLLLIEVLMGLYLLLRPYVDFESWLTAACSWLLRWWPALEILIQAA
jgi:3',5'-cyclic AMP phosphodiesterase CpdA